MFLSLPVSVKNSRPLGYWLTPILVDALSKQTGEKGLFCYGKLGLRSPSAEEENAYHRNLDFLNISSERITDNSLADDLHGLALQACNSNQVISRKQECFICPCGALTIPIEIVEYAKEKTFRRSEDAIVCKVCNQKAEIMSVENLFYTLKQETTARAIRVFPRLYQKEVDELVRQIHEQGIPISKVRPTGFVFGRWNLDVEFLWSLLPLTVSKRNNETVRVVIINQVLRQAIVAYLLAIELENDFEADLVVSPVIAHPGKIEKWNLDRLRTLGYDGDLLRFALLCSLGWNKKEANLYDSVATVEYRRFNLLKQAIKEANGKSCDLREAMRNLSQQNLVKGLGNVFNLERFDYRTLKGLLS